MYLRVMYLIMNLCESHAYESMWESCIWLCDCMWRCVRGYVSIWWYLCTCNDGDELWIMWIDLVMRWWCKYLIYLEFMVENWYSYLHENISWCIELLNTCYLLPLKLLLCSWFPLLSISHPFAGFLLCHLWYKRAGWGRVIIVSTRG